MVSRINNIKRSYSMAEYEIIAEYPQGGKAAYRKRWDAAKLRLQKHVYEVMDSFALRDRPIAHACMDWAKHVPPPPAGETYSYRRSDFVFYVTRLT